MAPNRRRVKLYMLSADHEWDNIGSGLISSAYIEQLQGVALLVISELDGSLVLESKINTDTPYQRQRENLIVWSEAENHGMALSFQDPATCQAIWEEICRIQGKHPSVTITQDLLDDLDELEDIPETSSLIDLPDCELSTLEQIADLVNSVLPSPVHREKLALMLENEQYIKNLLQLFHTCEAVKNTEGLHYLYDIIKGILLLNKTSLFEILLADEYIMDVVGCLEYDPDLAQPKRHREFLTHVAKFKEVIPITDCQLKQKIHQTHKAQYIHDILMPVPSVFEENVLSALTTFIYFNKVKIVNLLQDDDKFLSEVFALLAAETTPGDKQRELVYFLKEFCTFSQTLQPYNKNELFQKMTHFGVLSALKVVIDVDDLQIRSAATDILVYLVEHCPSVIRGFMVEEARHNVEGNLFINIIIKQMIGDADPELGGAVQLMGLLRCLLDPESMLTANHENQRGEFLHFFYRHCMHTLIRPILTTTSAGKCEKNNTLECKKNCSDNYRTAQLLAIILELLAFCVEHHSYYIKNFILSRDLLRKVLILMKSKHTFLTLCALRFMRRIIGHQDELYNRYIIKGNLFQPVINAFLENGTRYNMLNSAVIELFEYIKEENIKPLVTHIVRKFYRAVESIDYVHTFKELKIKYEQEKRRQSQVRTHLPSAQYSQILQGSARVFEEIEEMCFREDREERGTTMPPLETSEPKDRFPSPCDKVVEIQKPKVNEEEKTDLQEEPFGGISFTSSHSADAATRGGNPSSSSVDDLVEYPEDEDKEDDSIPRKRFHFNS